MEEGPKERRVCLGLEFVYSIYFIISTEMGESDAGWLVDMWIISAERCV